MKYIIDTYAWIEYLIGSRKGQGLRKLFENEDNEFLTIECTLSELKGWALKEDTNFENIYHTVKANSHIEPVCLEDWICAAEIKSRMRKTIKDFGLIDSLLIAKQRKYRSKIVSGDPHFKELGDVVYLQ